MMRPLLAACSLVLVPTLAGGWLPPSYEVPAAARWMFGALATLWIAVVLHGIGVGFAPTVAAMAVFAAAGARRVVPIARKGWALSSSRDRAIAALLLVPVLCAGLFTLSTPVDAGDALMAWYAKARGLLAWQPLARLPFAEYPDLGAMGWALLLRISGWGYEPVARLVFVAVYAAFALTVPDVLGRPLSRHAVWLVPLGVLATFDLRLITNGYQDAVVASAGGLAAVMLGRSLQTNDRGRATVGLVVAGSLGLFKVEGLVLGALLVASWLVVQGFRPLVVRWSIRALLAFGALSLWWPMMVSIHKLPATQGEFNSLQNLFLVRMPERVTRMRLIAEAFLATGPRFLVPLGAVLVLSIVAARRAAGVRRLLMFLGLAAAGHAAWIVVVFMLTNLDVQWHLATALDRLVLQQAIGLWTPAMIASAVCLVDCAAGPPVTGRRVPSPG
jgi:hypothetical protein